MPEAMLAELVVRVVSVAEREQAKPRERLAATRVLLQVAHLNLEAIEVAGRSEYGEAMKELEALRREVSGEAQLGSVPAGGTWPQGADAGPAGTGGPAAMGLVQPGLPVRGTAGGVQGAPASPAAAGGRRRAGRRAVGPVVGGAGPSAGGLADVVPADG